MSEHDRHDSRALWLMHKGFGYKRSALAVKTAEDKSKATTIVLIMMLILAAFGGAMISFEITTHIIFPPAQFVGICPAPAEITRGGCFIPQSTVSNGKTVTNYIPSGYVCSKNESIYQCEARHG